MPALASLRTGGHLPRLRSTVALSIPRLLTNPMLSGVGGPGSVSGHAGPTGASLEIPARGAAASTANGGRVGQPGMEARGGSFMALAGEPKSPGPASPSGGDDDTAAGPSCLDRVCRRRVVEEGNRTLQLHHADQRYGDNFITTSKYSAISFVPRSLFEQ